MLTQKQQKVPMWGNGYVYKNIMFTHVKYKQFPFDNYIQKAKNKSRGGVRLSWIQRSNRANRTEFSSPFGMFLSLSLYDSIYLVENG